MYKFDRIILDATCFLTEEDAPPPAAPSPPDAPAGAPPDAAATPPAATPPVAKKETTGFIAIVKLALAALKTTQPLLGNKDIHFTNPDEKAITLKKAYELFDVVKRNLPKQMQDTLFNDITVKDPTNKPDSVNNIIQGANLAVQALFSPDKAPEYTEYNLLFDIKEIDSKNAAKIYDQIRTYVEK